MRDSDKKEKCYSDSTFSSTQIQTNSGLFRFQTIKKTPPKFMLTY